jgi:hypothetical protein
MRVGIIVILKNRARSFLKIAFYASSRHVCFGAFASLMAWADMVDSGCIFVEAAVTVGASPVPRFKNVLPEPFTGKFWA